MLGPVMLKINDIQKDTKNRSLTMYDWLDYFGYPIKHKINQTSKVVWMFNSSAVLSMTQTLLLKKY